MIVSFIALFHHSIFLKTPSSLGIWFQIIQMWSVMVGCSKKKVFKKNWELYILGGNEVEKIENIIGE